MMNRNNIQAFAWLLYLPCMGKERNFRRYHQSIIMRFFARRLRARGDGHFSETLFLLPTVTPNAPDHPGL